MLDVPGINFGSKRKLALRASDGMSADEIGFDAELGFGSQMGFVGSIRSAPVAPTTFVFGGGTALRTRNG
ncbi:hypothetical protein [Cohnella yongneupensis]|uniref:Uncharacterized protein n=1 Tax=Cohnella yongneupensis TaxID=425006 RepID=A0ABW0QW93_9BACL